VQYLFHRVHARPGDVVSTGTPAGVGHGRTPPVYLRSGQVVRTAIEGIGELVNRCVPDPTGPPTPPERPPPSAGSDAYQSAGSPRARAAAASPRVVEALHPRPRCLPSTPADLGEREVAERVQEHHRALLFRQCVERRAAPGAWRGASRLRPRRWRRAPVDELHHAHRSGDVYRAAGLGPALVDQAPVRDHQQHERNAGSSPAKRSRLRDRPRNASDARSSGSRAP